MKTNWRHETVLLDKMNFTQLGKLPAIYETNKIHYMIQKILILFPTLSSITYVNKLEH